MTPRVRLPRPRRLSVAYVPRHRANRRVDGPSLANGYTGFYYGLHRATSYTE